MQEKRYHIIYEDDSVIVVDKPAGMLVIPTPKKETNTLTDLLNAELDSRGVEANAYPCHRIDRETSGIVIYAKGKRMQSAMMEEFRARRVKKTYTAFIQGSPKKDFDTIARRVYNRNKRRSEEAVTRYRVAARKRGWSVVEAEPVTGRTNQIRIHFKEIGHPLIGESVYAFRRDSPFRFRRVALHAAAISFKHPATGKQAEFRADMPDDMQKFLKENG